MLIAYCKDTIAKRILTYGESEIDNVVEIGAASEGSASEVFIPADGVGPTSRFLPSFGSQYSGN
jgi:hypothetical protein